MIFYFFSIDLHISIKLKAIDANAQMAVNLRNVTEATPGIRIPEKKSINLLITPMIRLREAEIPKTH